MAELHQPLLSSYVTSEGHAMRDMMHSKSDIDYDGSVEDHDADSPDAIHSGAAIWESSRETYGPPGIPDHTALREAC